MITRFFLLIVAISSTCLNVHAQDDFVDIGDATSRTYNGFQEVINNGSAKFVGSLISGDSIYSPYQNRLISYNVGDTYTFEMSVTARSDSRRSTCDCGVYLFDGLGDSTKIRSLEFKFNRIRPKAKTDIISLYTYNTFVPNYAKIYCDFSATTWVDNVEYLITRTHRATAPSGITMDIAKASIPSDLALLGTATISSPVDLVMTTVDRLDAGWTTTGANTSLTYTGSPDHVDLRFNAKVFILGSSNFQRPNYVAQVVRVNDGKILAQAASTYIRDSNDHEEASWNISVLDESPPTNPVYKVEYYRETSNATQIINIESDGASFSATAFNN